MKLIFGLGNPGKEFLNSRHNLGSIVVRRLAKRFKMRLKRERTLNSLVGRGRIKNRDVILALPLKFMNICGISLKQILEYFNIDLKDILVVCDDMDLEKGKIRLRLKGSDAGHRGLRSVIENLKTENFSRLKIGIGRPPEGVNPSDFVLGRFNSQELEVIKNSIEKAMDTIFQWIQKN